MVYFKNDICPVCHQPFQEEDDVVVCPECGAPYHRACFKEAGHCLFDEKHGSGFSYRPEPAQEQQEPQILCPRCQKSNPADAPACCNCGYPLAKSRPADPVSNDETAAEPTESAAGSDETGGPQIPAYQRRRDDVHPNTDKFRPADDGSIHPFADLDEEDESTLNDLLHEQLDAAQIGLDEKVDGFSVREWLSFIGPSAPVYLFHFKRMDQNRSGHSFSLSAMLFAPIYFLYRKMWLWGILALLGNLLCAVPTTLLLLDSYHLLADFPIAIQTVQQIALYASYFELAMHIFWGFASYTLYRRQCIQQMKQTKTALADAPEQTVYEALAKKGGVSMTGIIALVLAGVILYMSAFLFSF